MKKVQKFSKNTRNKLAVRFMYLPGTGWAVFFLTNSTGEKKKGRKSGNLSGRSAWCNTCSYNVYWIHHKASQPAAGWRCTTLTPGRAEMVWTTGSQGLSSTALWILGFEQERLQVSLFPSFFQHVKLQLLGLVFLQCYPAALCRDMCHHGRDHFQI